MLKFIADNAATIIVLLIVAGAVTAAAVKLIRDKKKGRSSCGCNCGSCPMSGSCHKNG